CACLGSYWQACFRCSCCCSSSMSLPSLRCWLVITWHSALPSLTASALWYRTWLNGHRTGLLFAFGIHFLCSCFVPARKTGQHQATLRSFERSSRYCLSPKV